jgi:hypothetical protein
MKTVQLTDSEWKTILYFLEELSDHQSNAGCNDLPRHISDIFSKAEGKQLEKEYAERNNPESPEGPDWPLPDFCLVSLLQHKIEKQLKA